MSQSVNLTAKTILKTNPVLPNSMSLYKDKKQTKIFIAQAKGIHIYDVYNQSFSDVKLTQSNSGIASCLTISDDLVFFCFGMRIYACGGNGKTLFEAETYLAVDKIDAIHVYGYQLWVVAGNLLNQFLIGGVQLSNKQSRITSSPTQKIQDVSSQILDVKINHSLLIKNDGQKPFLLLLKNNNQIEISDKKDGTFITTDSPPIYAYLYPCDKNSNRVLVGSMDGEILYLEVQRKKIKKLWSAKQNSKGRVNCIVQVKNGFIVFRDGAYQMWNANKECLGREQVNDKIQSSVYISELQSFYYGTTGGLIVEMYNYQKMMKMAKQRNEGAQKNRLIKEIEQLRKQKLQLKAKVDNLAALKGIKQSPAVTLNVTSNLSVDYTKLCYTLEISCDRPIVKLIIKGDIILFESGERVHFEGFQNKTTKVYVLKLQQKKLLTFRFKYQEQYHLNQKLICTIFADVQGRQIASIMNTDLKNLSLHQKVQSKLLEKTNAKMNVLRVQGQYKYIMMNVWLNCLFNDFGSPSPQEAQQYLQFCYQSLITKNKLYIQYRDKQCTFFSESPAPLSIIKKTIFEKAKQKNLSLSYQTKTNIEGLTNLLKKLQPKVKMFQSNKKQFQLLPGLQELKNDEISQDFQAFLIRSEDIKKKYLESERQYAQLKNAIKQLYISYRGLNNWEVSEYKLEELTQSLQNFNYEKIVKLIQQS